MALTETGGIYLGRVRQILPTWTRPEAVAGNATTEFARHLRVLAPPAFTVHQIAKHLPKFRALYPNVTLELSYPARWPRSMRISTSVSSGSACSR